MATSTTAMHVSTVALLVGTFIPLVQVFIGAHVHLDFFLDSTKGAASVSPCYRK